MNIERIKELAAMKVIWPKDGADIRKALCEYAEILEKSAAGPSDDAPRRITEEDL